MHDLHDRVFTDKTVLGQCWIEYAHAGAVRCARRIEQTPVGIGNRIQHGRAAG